MPTTVRTFNVNNLFVRYRFGQAFPGDTSGTSAVNEPSLGYLPMYDPDMFDLFNPLQRELTANACHETELHSRTCCACSRSRA